jgi:hypothetical protein
VNPRCAMSLPILRLSQRSRRDFNGSPNRPFHPMPHQQARRKDMERASTLMDHFHHFHNSMSSPICRCLQYPCHRRDCPSFLPRFLPTILIRGRYPDPDPCLSTAVANFRFKRSMLASHLSILKISQCPFQSSRLHIASPIQHVR